MKSNRKGVGCLVLVGLAVIFGIIGAVGSHNSSNSTSGASTPASSSIPVNDASIAVPADTVSAAAVPASSAPAVPASSAPAAPASSAPAGPSMTIAQQQAVEATQNYLSLGTGFSYDGLLRQLTSSAGSGFAQSDAEFAINYVHPDWDAQAVEAAKDYLQLGGFSQASLLQQLTSSAGSGFTEAQGEYAVNQTMK